MERIRNFGASANEPYSYRLADFAFRFHYGLVVPNESAIETAGARSVWQERIEPDAPFLFVSRSGFTDSFHEIRGEHPERPVIAWTLEDLFV